MADQALQFHLIQILSLLGQTGNGFVTEGKRTKHAEFGYPVTNFISSNSLYNDRTSNGRLCPFCLVESFEHAQDFKPDETDITGYRRTRSGLTG